MKQPGFEKLKKVSGELRRIFSKRDNPAQEIPKQRRLLVVEDEESICFSMSEYFGFHGYKVDIAHKTEEAEKLIESVDYEVVIQDLRLGTARASDGLYIVRLVHDRKPDTRLVVLTADGSVEIEAEARRCGADAFLRKPTPLSQIAQVVLGLIESPRAVASPQQVTREPKSLLMG